MGLQFCLEILASENDELFIKVIGVPPKLLTHTRSQSRSIGAYSSTLLANKRLLLENHQIMLYLKHYKGTLYWKNELRLMGNFLEALPYTNQVAQQWNIIFINLKCYKYRIDKEKNSFLKQEYSLAFRMTSPFNTATTFPVFIGKTFKDCPKMYILLIIHFHKNSVYAGKLQFVLNIQTRNVLKAKKKLPS